LEDLESATIKQKTKLFQILARPQVAFSDLRDLPKIEKFLLDNAIDEESIEQMEIECKYSGYLQKEKDNAAKLSRLEGLKIPNYVDYETLKSLSTEAKEKLGKIKPKTIAQASRISGVSPSDVSVLLVHMGR
jgi:tRNA uridine 5-carboxymethylaminomethyl modification enzyme